MNYKELHNDSLVVDTHCDTMLKVIRSHGAYRLRDAHEECHVDIPRLQKGGVNLQFFAAYIEPQFKPDRAIKRTLQLFDCFYNELEDNKDYVSLILSSVDLESARRDNKIGALLSIEGGEALEGDLAVLRMLHKLGVRAIGLTWNERNQIAEGVGECRSGGGLTEFGVSAVQEMNRLGIIVDVSHISEPGFWDVIKVSDKPIIASHSNAKAICNHVRNLSDDQIRALAKNGGVMGLNMCHEFLSDERPVVIEHVVDHIEHVFSLVGSKHIGIGADLDGITTPPVGLEDVSKLPALTEAMLRRGLTPDQVRDVLGENYLRVIKKVMG